VEILSAILATLVIIAILFEIARRVGVHSGTTESTRTADGPGTADSLGTAERAGTAERSWADCNGRPSTLNRRARA
jgi:hypothetical protein